MAALLSGRMSTVANHGAVGDGEPWGIEEMLVVDGDIHAILENGGKSFGDVAGGETDGLARDFENWEFRRQGGADDGFAIRVMGGNVPLGMG